MPSTGRGYCWAAFVWAHASTSTPMTSGNFQNITPPQITLASVSGIRATTFGLRDAGATDHTHDGDALQLEERLRLRASALLASRRCCCHRPDIGEDDLSRRPSPVRLGRIKPSHLALQPPTPLQLTLVARNGFPKPCVDPEYAPTEGGMGSDPAPGAASPRKG